MIFHSLETRCNEIRSVADHVGSQIAGLTDSRRYYSSLGLRHGTPLPSSPAAPDTPRTSCRRGRCAQPGDQRQDLANICRDLGKPTFYNSKTFGKLACPLSIKGLRLP